MAGAGPSESPSGAVRALSVPQKALRKMGLLRPVDLALHLPFRYEDETQLVNLADARDGEVVQIEAVVQSCQVVFKPRRQLQAVVDFMNSPLMQGLPAKMAQANKKTEELIRGQVSQLSADIQRVVNKATTQAARAPAAAGLPGPPGPRSAGSR